jgi:hypothetical protein
MDLKSWLKSDNYLTGAILALALAILCLLLVIPAGRLVQMLYPSIAFFDSSIMLLSLIPNLLVMRRYIVRIHLEKTGKGILIVTVILMALYFIFAHKHPFNLPV